MKLIKFGITLVHLILLLLLCIMLLNEFISNPYTNLLSLAFPFLIGFYLLLCLFWVVSFKKRAFIFIFGLILFINPIKRWVNYNKTNLKGDFKVLSLNSKAGKINPNELRNYLNSHKNFDIILLQEDLSESLNNSVTYGTSRLYTPHEIINHQIIFDEGYNGRSFYADIKIKGTIIRVINIYLEPFQLNKAMIKPSANTQENEEKAKSLLKKLIPTFKIHDEQIKMIKKVIDNSPYPLIVAGDFNSVPNSFEYYAIQQKLNDAFFEAGKGSGTSFHDYKFPIRIDYIFSSKNIIPKSYMVDRSVTISDHFPIIATFDF